MRKGAFIVTLIVVLALPAAAQTVISKPPDRGPFWAPIDAVDGTYVYAASFIAPATDVFPSGLGTWLLQSVAPGPSARFEIWGEAAGGGPDAAALYATTGSLALATTPTLSFYSAPVAGTPTALTPGQRYWFVITVVGESGTGEYQVGGHTQNSVYADNGTFWYSNDPAGVSFDGQSLTPEMAFQVTLQAGLPQAAAIPVTGPVGLGLLLLALAGVGLFLLRRA